MNIIKNNLSYLIGGIVGGIGRYLYYHYVGCSTGTCPITSSPTMSVLWGALLGALLFSIIMPKNKQSKTKLMELLNEGAVLLDVRTRGEFANGHAKDSKNIPLDELGKSLNKLDKTQKFVVVCASGMRSANAVNFMKKNGFTECYNGGSWVNFNH